jgi:allantoate deiminase
MDRRSDALVTAATIISRLPGLAAEEGEGTVITTGRLNVFPNGANVIPDKTVFTIDIRSGKEENVLNVIEKTKELIRSYNKDGIEISIEQPLYIQPKELSKDVRSLLKKKSDELGIPYCSINSGAGHDAMVFSDFTDVGLIFVPSKDGLSHCPEEWSDSHHLAQAVEILFETAKSLTEAEED